MNFEKNATSTILRVTSTYLLKRNLRLDYILPNGYFDFSKMPNLRVFAGPILKNYREQFGATQTSFAGYFSCNRRSIQNWEANISAIPFNLLQKIALRLGVDLIELLCTLEKENSSFSLISKRFPLPFNVYSFNSSSYLSCLVPSKNYRVYSSCDYSSPQIKILNKFLTTFFIFQKESKIIFPLTDYVVQWSKSNVDLLIPISILFITEGSYSKSNSNDGLVFVNVSKVLHDVLVDSIFKKFSLLPTSYLLVRRRSCASPIYITSYTNVSHLKLLQSVNHLVKNVKTSPHENQSLLSYLDAPQPDLSFILAKSNSEKSLAIALFIATEGSVYLSTRFGFIYPVFEIGCTNPSIIDFLEKLTSSLDLNFKQQKSGVTWSRLKGVRARGLSTALKLLDLDCFIEGVKITSKSKYFEGYCKKDLLLAILEFRIRQETNRSLFGLSTKAAALHISKILNERSFKQKEYYINFFSKKKRMSRYL